MNKEKNRLLLINCIERVTDTKWCLLSVLLLRAFDYPKYILCKQL
jgi:hypothetical protein